MFEKVARELPDQLTGVCLCWLRTTYSCVIRSKSATSVLLQHAMCSMQAVSAGRVQDLRPRRLVGVACTNADQHNKAYLIVAATLGLLSWPKRCLTPHTASQVFAALAVDPSRAARLGLGAGFRLDDGIGVPCGSCKRAKAAA
jgi:hypothetical protein